jgi:4'-phosphopantetheinyl transferase
MRGAHPQHAVWVWILRTDDGRPPTSRWRTLLSRDERRRSGRFLRARDRAAFVAAHALMRYALASHAGCAPVDLRFERDPLGRPRLVHPVRSGLEFSLSCTRGCAVCAVAHARDIGVDVELEIPRALREIARHYFSEAEREELRRLRGPVRRSRFYLLWTLKEALLKALGLGLTFRPDLISFNAASPEPGTVRVELPPTLGESADGWEFRSWTSRDHVRMSLAVRRIAAPLRLRFVELTSADLGDDFRENGPHEPWRSGDELARSGADPARDHASADRSSTTPSPGVDRRPTRR